MNWKEILCLDEQIYMKLPEDWDRPSGETIATKFPYGKKPQEIFANPDTYHIITLNILEKSLQENQIYLAILEIQRLISHMYPESIRESAKLYSTESGIAGYFSFITGGLECDSCHYMFVLPIKGKMMLGSSHFPEQQTKEERLIFFEVLKSIKASGDIEEGRSDGNGKKGVYR